MGKVTKVTIPDIGDFKNIEVIEVLVSVGQTIDKEDALLTLESEKASMDLPSPCAGTVLEIHAAIGDEVSEGNLVLLVEEKASPEPPDETKNSKHTTNPESEPLASPKRDLQLANSSGQDHRNSSRHIVEPKNPPAEETEISSATKNETFTRNKNELSHASPAVRRFGHELGVSLDMIDGSGRKGRILKSDVEQFVKKQLKESPKGDRPGRPSSPELENLDFAKWGSVEIKPLSRIQKRSGPRLLQSWNGVPHVTNHEEADVTDLEEFRRTYKNEADGDVARITLLPFIIKVVSAALTQFPRINSSLAANQTDLILKRYVHIGIAVDTMEGLIVPVIKDVNKKTIHQIASELGELSQQAKERKIKPDNLQGGCFTISSLGGIGGRGFTPIVNPPEVAILGVSRAKTSPEWDGTQFKPRLMLPLDLSYDHRVVDGANAARFLSFLKTHLEDIRRLLL